MHSIYVAYLHSNFVQFHRHQGTATRHHLNRDLTMGMSVHTKLKIESLHQIPFKVCGADEIAWQWMLENDDLAKRGGCKRKPPAIKTTTKSIECRVYSIVYRVLLLQQRLLPWLPLLKHRDVNYTRILWFRQPCKSPSDCG
jgi:hypothetical protein